MNIQQRADGGRTILALTGEFTIYEAGRAKDLLLASLERGQDLEMDLSGLSEIDTAGLQLLILAKREAMASGKTLALTGHSRPVVDLIELYGLAAWFGDPLVLPREMPGPGEQQ